MMVCGPARSACLIQLGDRAQFAHHSNPTHQCRDDPNTALLHFADKFTILAKLGDSHRA